MLLTQRHTVSRDRPLLSYLHRLATIRRVCSSGSAETCGVQDMDKSLPAFLVLIPLVVYLHVGFEVKRAQADAPVLLNAYRSISGAEFA